MLNLKRIMLMVMCFMCMMGSVAFADYPDYFNGDRNYVICGAHMGYAGFVDRSSVTVLKADDPIYVISVRVLMVSDADRGNTEIDVDETMQFLYDCETKRMYSKVGDNEWYYIKPVGCMAETGHHFPGELAFYIAYHKKFYGGRKWFDPVTMEYAYPNIGDIMYVLVDEAEAEDAKL